eukprot:TRINITY_DN840_c1_g1_i5.p1 TRINITY_DN840_c1_g1~~TRINITY_DN840_c1_g1_i5.p1  ORF type:complete len:352 (+),score=94.11 TRINITY_DN840_c1_g1_i5:449-1504(+)
MVKGHIPEYRFFDLRSLIEVHELLDSRKERSLEEVKWFVQGLQRVETKLEERLEEVKREVGIGEKIMGWVNEKLKQVIPREIGGGYPGFTDGKVVVETKEVMFLIRAGDPYVRRVRVEFEIELGHERAVNELEEFLVLVDKYFEVSQDQNELRERREQQERERREMEKREREEQDRLRALFGDSTIVQNEREKRKLDDWLKEARDEEIVKKTTLLFRGSRDGMTASDFHKNCDGQGATVVLFGTSTGRRGGGYTHISWSSGGGDVVDREGKCFIFSLDHQSKHKYKVGSGRAIANYSWHGPIFGSGSDFWLLKKSQNAGYSKPGSFELPNDTHLTGSPSFQLSDVEVWKIE